MRADHGGFRLYGEGMSTTDPTAALWARFRFSILGPLFASPPLHGRLKAKLRELADATYEHPVSGEPYRVSVQTLERWLYEARAADDPISNDAPTAIIKRLVFYS
jgi:hypothetical protein